MKEKVAVRTILKNYPYLMEFVLGDDDLMVDSGNLKTQRFLDLGYELQLLVKIARNLWGGEGELSLYFIAQNLGDDDYKNFLAALTDLRIKD